MVVVVVNSAWLGGVEETGAVNRMACNVGVVYKGGLIELGC